MPTHPMIVHLPLALAVLAPLFAGVATWVLHRRGGGRGAWSPVVGLLALTLATGLLSLRTGEADEEQVERVVAESAIEAHEEAAEQFVAATGAVLVLAGAGLLLRRPGALRAVGIATTVASVALAGLAVNTGEAGGELVYRHGAADAWRDAPAPSGPLSPRD